MSHLYRSGKLGESLVEALDTLLSEGKITETLAMQVLAQFDKSMSKTFDKEVTAKATLKGKLDVYRYIDNVWTFVLSKDATLRVTPTMGSSKRDEEEIIADGPLKLVLVDAKVVKFDDEDGPDGGGSGANKK